MKNAKLADFSTIKIGGEAKYLVFPRNTSELRTVLKKAEGLRVFILGNGSNVLFADSGFDGVVVNLKHFDKVTKFDSEVWVGGGINLFALNHKLQNMGLSGMEWSYGIPATLGGMVVGNGGCFGHDMAEVVQEVVVLDKERLRRLKKEEIVFGYRFSSLKDFIVLKVKIALKTAKNEQILENMNNFYQQKRISQPCDMPSLGSVFKRVVKDDIIFPAKLIDNMGLKGVKIGGAEISQKHAGFIVNAGGASSEDFVKLVELLERKMAEIGVFPEREIIFVR